MFEIRALRNGLISPPLSGQASISQPSPENLKITKPKNTNENVVLTWQMPTAGRYDSFELVVQRNGQNGPGDIYPLDVRRGLNIFSNGTYSFNLQRLKLGLNLIH